MILEIQVGRLAQSQNGRRVFFNETLPFCGSRRPELVEGGGTGSGPWLILKHIRALSSAGSERTPHTRKVAGSIPAAPTKGRIETRSLVLRLRPFGTSADRDPSSAHKKQTPTQNVGVSSKRRPLTEERSWDVLGGRRVRGESCRKREVPTDFNIREHFLAFQALQRFLPAGLLVGRFLQVFQRRECFRRLEIACKEPIDLQPNLPGALNINPVKAVSPRRVLEDFVLKFLPGCL